jgi:hypothetical protein
VALTLGRAIAEVQRDKGRALLYDDTLPITTAQPVHCHHLALPLVFPC